MTNFPLSLAEVFEHIPCNIYWLDRNNTIIGCNKPQAVSHGFSDPKDLIGKNLDQIIPNPYLRVVLKNNAKIFNSGESHVFEEMSQTDVLWLSHKVPLYNQEGHITGLLGVSQELCSSNISTDDTNKDFYINQIKNLSMSIMGYDKTSQASSLLDYFISIRNHYERIISLMPGHVYWVNKAGYILGCNTLQAEAFHYRTPKEIIGKTCHELLPLNEANKLMSINKKVIADKSSIFAEEQITLPDSEVRTYFSQKTPLLDENQEAIGVLGISIDISDRKKIETDLIQAKKRAETANNAKTEFLMNMSHDLRTPCSGILGFAKILHNEETDPDKKEKLNHIVQSSGHLLNLLNEILDCTKFDSSDFAPKNETFELPLLITNILELLQAKIKQKKLDVKFEYSALLPTFFIGDPLGLHRILFNLLSNAVKFTSKGHIDLIVKPSKNNPKNHIEVIISDTGIGIDPTKIDRIFDKFSRLNPSYDGIYQGTGLGLNIVKKLIDKMDGKITVDSQLNKGAVFNCSLPLVFSDKKLNNKKKTNRQSAPVKKSLLNLTSKQTRNALIIEDDPVSQHITEYLLQQHNCNVTVTESAAAALSTDLAQYDFIILDIGLPDIDGFTLASKIRQWEHNNKTTKPLIIIGLTAHINPQQGELKKENGINLLLNKPLTKETIENL